MAGRETTVIIGGNQELECIPCKVRFGSQGAFNQHVFWKHTQNTPQYKCQTLTCGQIFSSWEALTTHEKVAHPPDPNKAPLFIPLILYNAQTKTWDCLYCDATFQLKCHLEEHQQVHAPTPVVPAPQTVSSVTTTSVVSQDTEDNPRSLEKNINVTPDQVTKGAAFPSIPEEEHQRWEKCSKTLTDHYCSDPPKGHGSSTKTDAFICKLCNVLLASEEDLLRHVIERHSQSFLIDGEHYFCHVCQIRFTRLCSFHSHLKLHHMGTKKEDGEPSEEKHVANVNTNRKGITGKGEGDFVTAEKKVTVPAEKKVTVKREPEEKCSRQETPGGFKMNEETRIEVPVGGAEVDDLDFECRFCSKGFSTLKQMIIHERMIHGEELNKNLKERPPTSPPNKRKKRGRPPRRKNKKQGRSKGQRASSSLEEFQSCQRIIDDLRKKLSCTEKLLRKTVKDCRRRGREKKMAEMEKVPSPQRRWSCNVTKRGVKISIRRTGEKEGSQGRMDRRKLEGKKKDREPEEEREGSGFKSRNRFQCRVCKKWIPGLAGLRRHLAEKHGEEKRTETKEGDKGEVPAKHSGGIGEEPKVITGSELKKEREEATSVQLPWGRLIGDPDSPVNGGGETIVEPRSPENGERMPEPKSRGTVEVSEALSKEESKESSTKTPSLLENPGRLEWNKKAPFRIRPRCRPSTAAPLRHKLLQRPPPILPPPTPGPAPKTKNPVRVNPSLVSTTKSCPRKGLHFPPSVVALMRSTVILDRLILEDPLQKTYCLKRKNLPPTPPIIPSLPPEDILVPAAKPRTSRELRVMLKRVDDDDFDFSSVDFLQRLC